METRLGYFNPRNTVLISSSGIVMHVNEINYLLFIYVTK